MSKIFRAIGYSMIFLSIAMAILGLCMFSYNGKTSQFVYLLGKYSFFYFLEVGVIGIGFLLISKVRF
jgi:hypothetical protein